MGNIIKSCNVINNKDLFPTKFSFFIFIIYMILFVNQGLLVTASRNGTSAYSYNPTTVVLLTEFLKLAISSAVYLKDHSISTLMSEIQKNYKLFGFYMIPALAYCCYNNLSFTNLTFFDPTTYFMLMQTRLLLVGVIYQFLFKRKLSRIQWLSLFLVTLGCVIQKLDWNIFNSESQSLKVPGNLKIVHIGTGLTFILIQMSCSVFAGVYCEYLIKNVAGMELDIMVQNIFMYLDSIICNATVLAFKGELNSSFSGASISSILQVLVLSIILNNALVGIVTSLFLKNLNSILKSFASALELVLTAICSYLLLSVPLKNNTILAVAIVSYAVVLYARNPVKNEDTSKQKESSTKNKLQKETKINLGKNNLKALPVHSRQ